MPTSYPGGLDAFTNPAPSDTLDSPPHDVQHADVNDAVEAIEAELGTDPSGTFPTVRERVEGVEAALSGLVLDDIADVAAPAPVDGQVLTWDTGTAAWRPETPSGGGSAMPAWLNAFADPPLSDPMDDDFADGVIASKWTQRWVGSPAPTYAEESALSTLWIDRGPIDFFNLASLMQAAPSGDFTVETGIAISDHGNVNWHIPNILLVSRAAGTDSDLYTIGWRPVARELSAARMTSYSGWVGDDTKRAYSPTPLTRFRFRRQSGVWYFEFSNAGRTWYTLRQLAEPWVPAEVGIGINVENAGAGLSGGFRYFRRTA